MPILKGRSLRDKWQIYSSELPNCNAFPLKWTRQIRIYCSSCKESNQWYPNIKKILNNSNPRSQPHKQILTRWWAQPEIRVMLPQWNLYQMLILKFNRIFELSRQKEPNLKMHTKNCMSFYARQFVQIFNKHLMKPFLIDFIFIFYFISFLFLLLFFIYIEEIVW